MKYTNKNLKLCQKCRKFYIKSEFKKNPRGSYCKSCYNKYIKGGTEYGKSKNNMRELRQDFL